jgi:hypothetical protein
MKLNLIVDIFNFEIRQLEFSWTHIPISLYVALAGNGWMKDSRNKCLSVMNPSEQHLVDF